jgi:hypothetical protein
VKGSAEGGGRWKVAIPVRHASNYRLEAFLAPLTAECKNHVPFEEEFDLQSPWWTPPVAEHTVPSLAGIAKNAAYFNFRLLHQNKVSWWWSAAAQVQPVASWMEMMRAAVQAGADSMAAMPALRGDVSATNSPHGLWLEFGVGSGKTTAYIGSQMKSLLGDTAVLHGFDSFQGLPTSWAHTNLEAGTFSMGGEIPEHLTKLPNVKVHVGLFSETLGDLGEFGDAPVAFVHVDVDLYASAVEVLSRVACQLHPGSVVVFDELVNYAGFELSGEFRAWEYITSIYGILWSYAGVYWQQAVPVMITGRGSAC